MEPIRRSPIIATLGLIFALAATEAWVAWRCLNRMSAANHDFRVTRIEDSILTPQDSVEPHDTLSGTHSSEDEWIEAALQGTTSPQDGPPSTESRAVSSDENT